MLASAEMEEPPSETMLEPTIEQMKDHCRPRPREPVQKPPKRYKVMN